MTAQALFFYSSFEVARHCGLWRSSGLGLFWGPPAEVCISGTVLSPSRGFLTELLWRNSEPFTGPTSLFLKVVWQNISTPSNLLDHLLPELQLCLLCSTFSLYLTLQWSHGITMTSQSWHKNGNDVTNGKKTTTLWQDHIQTKNDFKELDGFNKRTW